MKRSKCMSTIDFADFEQRVRARGYSMNQFFEYAGVNKSTWNRWMRNENKPNTGTLEKLNDALADLPNKNTKKARK